ncbi:hypothetical protein SADUNF_Sadunf16G0230500 [Salix dunnii]|uniref:Uncharacterized protein n=1 Tax=Salix dunnii TaxID=1413687 RepID=A0A835JDM7_9ROSI|nr:hypothetical protein SADUNF_Sadunf16G0230500 [Salix dunnii]
MVLCRKKKKILVIHFWCMATRKSLLREIVVAYPMARRVRVQEMVAAEAADGKLSPVQVRIGNTNNSGDQSKCHKESSGSISHWEVNR